MVDACQPSRVQEFFGRIFGNGAQAYSEAARASELEKWQEFTVLYKTAERLLMHINPTVVIAAPNPTRTEIVGPKAELASDQADKRKQALRHHRTPGHCAADRRRFARAPFRGDGLRVDRQARY